MNGSGNPGGNPLRRMMLALDALSCETALIEAAALIAAKLEAELDALFVEDDDVYRVADLPITREISLSSAREREISASRVEQTLRGLSREAERRFGAATQRSRVKGHFHVTRARRDEAIGAAALQVDLLLLQPRKPTLVRVFVRDNRPPRVFVLCGQTPARRRALELGARLARDDHHVLEVIVAGEVDAELRRELERSGLIVVVREHPPQSAALAMLADVDNRSGATVLVAGDLLAADSRNPALECLSQLRCQVLLVN